MVGILVNHDVVGVPEPAPRVANIIGSDREEETVKAESRRPTALKAVYVTGSKDTREVTVSPRTSELIVNVFTSLVTDPPVRPSVNVGAGGMTSGLREMLLGGGMRGVGHGRGAVFRNVTATDFMPRLLCSRFMPRFCRHERTDATDKKRDQQRAGLVHPDLRPPLRSLASFVVAELRGDCPAF
jgi:hypothetical protein